MASVATLPSGREASRSKKVFGQSRSITAIGSFILRPRGANTIRDVSAANTFISFMRQRIALDGVVDGMQRVGHDRSLAPVHPDYQLPDRLAVAARLHDRRAVDDDGRPHERVRVTGDDDVDPGHGAREVDVVAFGDGTGGRLPHAAVAHADDDVRAFLAQALHHFPSRRDVVGEGECARIDRPRDGVRSHHAEQAEPDAAALDHLVRADRSSLGQRFHAVEFCISRIEVRVGGQNRGHAAGVPGGHDRVRESGRPEVEIMIAEGGRVVSRHRQALQLGARVLEGASEWRADAGVADIEHEHRSFRFARAPAIGNQRGDAFDAANRAVVVERRRRVLRRGADADEIGVDVVGVQDGECPGHLVHA